MKIKDYRKLVQKDEDETKNMTVEQLEEYVK